MIENKTPKEIEKIKIIDPASGSGSFLLGAYDYLLKYHINWYSKNSAKSKGKKNDPLNPDGSITTEIKKKILLNNIYGVDIDANAVEVTKLSLLLKCLEGETDASIKQQMSFFNERVLPTLDSNIKSGNSLIDTDFYEIQSDRAVLKKVKPFNWESNFPEVFKQGGFDAVIGNPPYGLITDETLKEYYSNKYISSKKALDNYIVFCEKANSLGAVNAQISYIVPSSWLGGVNYHDIRKLMLSLSIEKLVLLPFDIFEDAYIDTVVFVSKKAPVEQSHYVQTYEFKKRAKIDRNILHSVLYDNVPIESYLNNEDMKIVLNAKALQLISSCVKNNIHTFDEYIEIKRGILASKDAFVSNKKSSKYFRYFEGDVYRYKINKEFGKWISLDSDGVKEAPKEVKWFTENRILLRRLVNRQQRLMASLETSPYITNKNIYSILQKQKHISLNVILSILNSKLVSYLYINMITQATKDDFPQVTITDIKKLPFPNFSNKKTGTELDSYSDKVIMLKKEANSDLNQIQYYENQIDKLVYELYGLTKDQVRIIEEATSGHS